MTPDTQIPSHVWQAEQETSRIRSAADVERAKADTEQAGALRELAAAVEGCTIKLGALETSVAAHVAAATKPGMVERFLSGKRGEWLLTVLILAVLASMGLDVRGWLIPAKTTAGPSTEATHGTE